MHSFLQSAAAQQQQQQQQQQQKMPFRSSEGDPPPSSSSAPPRSGARPTLGMTHQTLSLLQPHQGLFQSQDQASLMHHSQLHQQRQQQQQHHQHQSQQHQHQHQHQQHQHQHQHQQQQQIQQYSQYPTSSVAIRPGLDSLGLRSNPSDMGTAANQNPLPPSLPSSGSASAAALVAFPNPAPLAALSPPPEDDQMSDDGERGGAASGRWTRDEAAALIRVRTDIEIKHKDFVASGTVWEELSRRLAEVGYNRSGKKCKEKFENVFKYYKKKKESTAARQKGKNYHLFNELEAFDIASCGGTLDVNAPIVGSSDARPMERGGLGDSSPFHVGGGEMERTLLGSSGQLQSTMTRMPDAPPTMMTEKESSMEISFSSDSCDSESDKGQDRTRKGDGAGKEPWSSTKLFFESLVMRVLEQQEILHKKFLEALERRDQERQLREENYRRLEMARLNREYDLRVQEHNEAASHDAALIGFLQKVSGGQSLQLPRVSLPSNWMTTPPSENRISGGGSGSMIISTSRDSELSQQRWPKSEVQALVQIRSGLEPRFQDPGPKARLWDEISASLARLGYRRSAKRCRDKWDSINKYFQKTLNSRKKRSKTSKTCPYYDQLSTLYQKGVLSAAPTDTPSGNLSPPPENTLNDDGDTQQTVNERLMLLAPPIANDRETVPNSTLDAYNEDNYDSNGPQTANPSTDYASASKGSMIGTSESGEFNQMQRSQERRQLPEVSLAQEYAKDNSALVRLMQVLPSSSSDYSASSDSSSEE